MVSIETQIEIDAPAAIAWRLLANLPGYPEWNPSIVSLEGAARIGAPLRLRARLPGGFPIAMSAVVSTYDFEHEFAWTGRLSFLMTGVHRFALQEQPGGGVRLVQSEAFTGFIAPLFGLLFARPLRRSYEEANARFKLMVDAEASVLRP